MTHVQLKAKLWELSCDRHSHGRELGTRESPSFNSSVRVGQLKRTMEDGERRLSLPSATRLNGCTKQLAGSPCLPAPCSLLSPCQESSSY